MQGLLGSGVSAEKLLEHMVEIIVCKQRLIDQQTELLAEQEGHLSMVVDGFCAMDSTRKALSKEKAELLQQVSELEINSETMLGPLISKERQLTDRAVACRNAALAAARRGCPVPTRVLGDMDHSSSGPLAAAARNGRITDRHAAALFELLQDPSFNPWTTDHSVDPPVRRPDYDNENVQRVAAVCGSPVSRDMVRAILELEEHNPSGRYPVELPWHFGEGRELYPAEVVNLLASASCRRRSRHSSSSNASSSSAAAVSGVSSAPSFSGSLVSAAAAATAAEVSPPVRLSAPSPRVVVSASAGSSNNSSPATSTTGTVRLTAATAERLTGTSLCAEVQSPSVHRSRGGCTSITSASVAVDISTVDRDLPPTSPTLHPVSHPNQARGAQPGGAVALRATGSSYYSGVSGSGSSSGCRNVMEANGGNVHFNAWPVVQCHQRHTSTRGSSAATAPPLPNPVNRGGVVRVGNFSTPHVRTAPRPIHLSVGARTLDRSRFRRPARVPPPPPLPPPLPVHVSPREAAPLTTTQVPPPLPEEP